MPPTVGLWGGGVTQVRMVCSTFFTKVFGYTLHTRFMIPKVFVTSCERQKFDKFFTTCLFMEAIVWTLKCRNFYENS